MVVVLIARFVAVLRSVIGFIAGANRMLFAKFMIANSTGAVAGHCSTGLEHIIGKGVEEFARPFALALAVVGAIVVISMIVYWRSRAFGSGFLIFSDYMKPPIRLSALMELPVIYVFTHDFIGVGEDGPTHQPVEQLAALRSIPGLITLRPADANEAVEAWRVVIGLKHQPACGVRAASRCRRSTEHASHLRMVSRVARISLPMQMVATPR